VGINAGGNEVKRSTMLLIAAFCLIIAFALQSIFLARYVGRLPHDWVGIGLYGAALSGFALAAAGFIIQWGRQKRIEKHRLPEE